MLVSFIYIYIYFPPLPYPTIYFHACIHSPSLPSPPLGCPTYSNFPFPNLTTLPLPSTTIASLLSTPHHSPTQPSYICYSFPSHHLPSAALSYPSPPLQHLIPYLSSNPLPSPRQPSPTLPTLPSTPLPYAILSSHLIYFPHLPSPRISSPPHPFLTPLPYSPPPLPSPTIHLTISYPLT